MVVRLNLYRVFVVNKLLHIMPLRGRTGRASSMLFFVACLLVAIRVVAGFVCHTCFLDFEQPTSRSFHLHAGGDRDPCHHGQAEASPLTTWACTVTQDETAFILPDVPRLPLVVSAFVPLVLLLLSYRTLFQLTAHGRGPPVPFS